MNTQEFKDIDKIVLLNETHKMKVEGWRLAQICATLDKGGGGYVLLYSFVKDYKLVNVRIKVQKDEDVESIGWLYDAAFLYENEMKDLYGVKIIEMNVDFHGTLYKTATDAPFAAKDAGEAEEKTDGGEKS